MKGQALQLNVLAENLVGLWDYEYVCVYVCMYVCMYYIWTSKSSYAFRNNDQSLKKYCVDFVTFNVIPIKCSLTSCKL
jgi:hypothetical protein